MVLIISTEQDKSTNVVIDWLDSLNTEYIRLNDQDKITIQSISLGREEEVSFVIKKKNKTSLVNLNDIDGFWFRRGDFISYRPKISSKYLQNVSAHYIKKEWETIKKFLYQRLDGKNSIGNFYKEIQNNKLIDLHLASKVGLETPSSIISSNKDVLKSFFFKKDKKVISKPLKNEFNYDDNIKKVAYRGVGTFAVELADLEKLDQNFHFPIFLQERIEKDFELRVFYLAEKQYSMAIFSQRNPRTSVDFRNYDDRVPNRVAPYKLPVEVGRKLNLFMKEAGLNCGSIDMIVTKKGEYIFLEVNPVGQFDWVARNCNYPIEEDIALYLTKKPNSH